MPPQSAPPTVPAFEWVDLGDEVVLFSAEGEELHVLNSSAARCWKLHAEGLPLPAIARTVATEYSADEAVVRQDVESFFAGLHQLLPQAEGNSLPPLILDDESTPRVARRAENPIRYEAAFCGVGVELLSEDEEALRRVRQAFVPPLLGSAPVQRRISLLKEGSAYTVAIDGFVMRAEVPAAELAPELVRQLIWTVLNLADYWLYFHGAAVSRGADAALLVAPKGSGKTTLTAALVHAGFHFHSDDVVLLTGEREVMGLPFALKPKTGSWEPLRSRYRLLDDAEEHQLNGLTFKYLQPPFLPPPTGRPALRYLVFPEYRAGAATELRPIPPGEALSRLTASQCWFRDTASAALVRRFVELVRATPRYSLTFGELDEAVRAVEYLFARNEDGH